MMKNLKLGILIFVTFLIAGCSSIFSPVELPQINTYILKINNNYSFTKVASNATNLLVSVPTAPTWLNTTKMAYQVHPSQINYFSKNEWADTPAHMLQNLVVQCLQQSGYFHAVIAAPFSGNYDNRLDLHLLDFSQDFTVSPSQFHLRILVILEDGKTNQVIRSAIINEVVTSAINSPEGGVQAANQAVSQLNSSLLRFMQMKKIQKAKS